MDPCLPSMLVPDTALSSKLSTVLLCVLQSTLNEDYFIDRLLPLTKIELKFLSYDRTNKVPYIVLG